jgi:hypothetical protein
MRRVTDDGPHEDRGYLHGVAEGPQAEGSAAWQTWLATPGPEQRTFSVAAGGAGRHRAGREWRAAGPGRSDERAYWYVKVRVGRKIQRFYLGPATALDAERLAAVATAIATARTAAGKETGPQPNR